MKLMRTFALSSVVVVASIAIAVAAMISAPVDGRYESRTVDSGSVVVAVVR
jgi:hypothetical protein